MPAQAKTARHIDGTTPVLKTFAWYYDKSGKLIKHSSLGVGSIDPDIASERARVNPPRGAVKFMIFNAQANRQGRSRIMSQPTPRTGRRKLRV